MAMYAKSTVFPIVTPASAGFLLDLLSDPEDGSNMILKNVWLSPNYKELQPIR
jgi:hypothetical protein